MKNKVLLFMVVGIAFALRFWMLGQVPASPDWDEVSLGYNAYSILQTGKDEYGQVLPIIFRSFDDYKPGLYVYLAMPFVFVGGLSIEMVRLPSILIGSLAVLGVYFLTKELLLIGYPIKSKYNDWRRRVDYIALTSAALLAVSPWHIQFSRVAFEASVGMAFTIFGTLFFLKGLSKTRYYLLTALFFGLAVHVYQSEKVFIPLLAGVLGLIFWRDLLARWKAIIAPVLVFIVVAGPFFYQTIANPDALLRAKGVSLFADQTPFLEQSVRRLTYDDQTGNVIGKVFDNRRVAYGIGFVNGYLSHFDINWLFISGDQARHNPPNFGHLFLIELPFLLLGIYLFLFGSFSSKAKWLIFGWLIITPIPASITSGTPHPIRTIHFLPGMHILSAVGVVGFASWLKNRKLHCISKFGVVGLVLAFAIFNFVYYLEQYFVQYNYYSSQDWQYGYKEVVEYTDSVKDKYDTIVVSSEAPLDQSYMFFLFYTKYDPSTYLSEGGTYSGGFAQENSFGKYMFRPIDWNSEDPEGRVLYIGRPGDIGSGVVKTILFLDGTEAILIGEK